MKIHVMYYGTMPGYQVTKRGGVALYPGDNYLERAIAEELLDRDIVRPPIAETVEEAAETEHEPARGRFRRSRRKEEYDE